MIHKCCLQLAHEMMLKQLLFDVSPFLILYTMSIHDAPVFCMFHLSCSTKYLSYLQIIANKLYLEATRLKVSVAEILLYRKA